MIYLSQKAKGPNAIRNLLIYMEKPSDVSRETPDSHLVLVVTLPVGDGNAICKWRRERLCERFCKMHCERIYEYICIYIHTYIYSCYVNK